MPWSSSPRFSNGSITYSLLAFQVAIGDGSVSAQVALLIAHKAMTTKMPTSGNTIIFTLDEGMDLSFRALHIERQRVLFGLGGIEDLAVEEGLGRVVEPAVRVAELLHRLFVDVAAHDLLGDALVVGRALDHAPAAELREP